MTGKEKVLRAMEGKPTNTPPVAPYVSWPEYGWRFLDKPVWEVVLGCLDGISARKLEHAW